jgi:hypothetical protein
LTVEEGLVQSAMFFQKIDTRQSEPEGAAVMSMDQNMVNRRTFSAARLSGLPD